MKKAYKIAIPNPCFQNWDLMEQNITGRYCISCAKNLVDFTELSDKEIVRFVNSSRGEVCGRVTSHQLNRVLQDNRASTLSNSNWFKILAGIVFALGTKNTHSTDHVTQIKSVTTIVDTNFDNTNKQIEISKIDSVKQVARGRVLDIESNEPLCFILVYLKNEPKSVKCLSDQNGNFQLAIPEQFLTDTLTLAISAVGYNGTEIKVSKKHLEKEINIYLHSAIIGKIVVINQKKRWHFWK